MFLGLTLLILLNFGNVVVSLTLFLPTTLISEIFTRHHSIIRLIPHINPKLPLTPVSDTLTSRLVTVPILFKPFQVYHLLPPELDNSEDVLHQINQHGFKAPRLDFIRKLYAWASYIARYDIQKYLRLTN
jgi:hypothetical protein